MQRQLAILTNDLLNRKGEQFALQALEDMLWQKGLTGVPSLISHDALRPVGWCTPFGLYLESGISRVVGEYLIAENLEDGKLINDSHYDAYIARNKKDCGPHIGPLEKELDGYLSPGRRFIYTGAAAVIDSSIVERVFPTLFTNKDKHGLIYLSELLRDFEYKGQGILAHRGGRLCIYCHKFFRRNLSYLNSFHFEFLNSLMALSNRPEISIRIAVDPDIIGLSESFKEYQELEYWWGPKYNDDISIIPPGVTIYKSDDHQRVFSGVSGTEYWWKHDGNRRVLEMEELRDLPTGGSRSGNYGCRYIHSIYDSKDKKFEHFDGAIRMYTDEAFMERIGQAIDKSGKNSSYTKLFRIDGMLPLSEWKSLTTSYYQGNPLLYEYFGQKEEHTRLIASFNYSNSRSSALESKVPYFVEPLDGVKLFLSYHPKSEANDNVARVVINPDYIQSGNGKVAALEFSSLEIKKALQRLGHEVVLPTDVVWVRASDNYLSFPTILHSPNSVGLNLDGTIQAYKLLLGLMNEKYSVVFTLAWQLCDREIRLSVFGKIKEILGWVNVQTQLPLNRSEVRSWLEQQREWLTNAYPESTTRPDPLKIVRRDGVIFLKRQTIKREWIEYENDEVGLKYTLNIPPDQAELSEAYKNGLLRVALLSSVKRVRCSKTNENYFETQTSKILDSDVTALIEESGIVNLFWTSG